MLKMLQGVLGHLLPVAGPLLIISTSGLQLSEDGRRSKKNKEEAKIVLQHCKQLLMQG
jgi:hypothetical protein